MSDITIPKRVFIVPYRNRVHHKFFFCNQMKFILEGETDYEIYFVHQTDSRPFNRGAAKNIGFLAMKEKYPDDYQNIIFIFNDVDTLPFHRIFDYKTEPGIVKHYYGFETSLGGIVVITGSDFEKTNGYPNFWGWGMEDASLQKRCVVSNLAIDRSVFYPIGSPEILQLFDGVSRLVSSRDTQRLRQDIGQDGIRTITNLSYLIEDKSSCPDDNVYVTEDPHIHYINVATFMTLVRYEKDQYHEYDLREPARKISHPDQNAKFVNVGQQQQQHVWTNIPHIPTELEKIEMAKKRGLQQQYQQQQQPKQQQQYQQQQPKQQQQYQQQRAQQVDRHINVYSQEYAQHRQVKPRATTSASIGLGGVR